MLSEVELLTAIQALNARYVTIGDSENYVTICAIVSVQSTEVLDIESVACVLKCRTSDVAGVSRGTGVTIAEGESYSVLRVSPRNDGLADVSLVAFATAAPPNGEETEPEPPPTPPPTPRPGKWDEPEETPPPDDDPPPGEPED